MFRCNVFLKSVTHFKLIIVKVEYGYKVQDTRITILVVAGWIYRRDRFFNANFQMFQDVYSVLFCFLLGTKVEYLQKIHAEDQFYITCIKVIKYLIKCNINGTQI